MSLNIKGLYPLNHPEVTFPKKGVEGRQDCRNEDEAIKSWSNKKFILIKKKKKAQIEDKEASPLQKLNIL